jgi:ribonuclease P protein component
MIISKRAVRSAVRRNRLKRLVRESFRGSMDVLPAMDVVIQLTGDSADDELRTALSELWVQLATDGGGSASEPR